MYYWVEYILYIIINPYTLEYSKYTLMHIGLQPTWPSLQLIDHKWLFLDENHVKNCSNGRMKKPLVVR
jgi:hypothetical protein